MFYALGLTLIFLIINSPIHSGKAAPNVAQEPFVGKVKPISEGLAAQIVGISWNPGCPVGLESLRLLEMDYWKTDGSRQRGKLIIHESVASEVLGIFEQLFQNRFPFESIEPISSPRFGGSDNRSMDANNTSAFNCRPKTGRSKGYSVHSYGKAIDINPLWNPYIKKKRILPLGGKSFVGRLPCRQGMLCSSSLGVKKFKENGWIWGGDWKSLKDYQHFEKN